MVDIDKVVVEAKHVAGFLGNTNWPAKAVAIDNIVAAIEQLRKVARAEQVLKWEFQSANSKLHKELNENHEYIGALIGRFEDEAQKNAKLQQRVDELEGQQQKVMLQVAEYVLGNVPWGNVEEALSQKGSQ